MIKKCKIEGCNKDSRAKGLCLMHYYRFRKGITDMRPGRLPPGRFPGYGFNDCQIEGCLNKHYSKHLCKNHYELNRRNGNPEYKYPHVDHCLVEGCLNNGKFTRGYCGFHYMRWKRGIPLDFKGRPNKGKKNHNWKGGIAEYPNHSLMKRNRKEVLKEANYICQFCGGIADQIHHKDLSKDNHAKENLVACCHKCNHLPEHRKPSTSKYKRLYGLTVKELIKIGVYDEVRKINKRVENFKSTTLQAA